MSDWFSPNRQVCCSGLQAPPPLHLGSQNEPGLWVRSGRGEEEGGEQVWTGSQGAPSSAEQAELTLPVSFTLPSSLVL